MGQKAHPIGVRLHQYLNWHGQWCTTSKSLSAMLVFQTYHLTHLFQFLVAQKRSLIQSLSFSYVNTTLYCFLNVVPTYGEWLRTHKTFLTRANYSHVTTQRQLVCEKTGLFCKGVDHQRLGSVSMSTFTLGFFYFLKATWFFVKQQVHKPFAFSYWRRLLGSLSHFTQVRRFVVRLKNTTKTLSFSPPKRPRFPTDDWSYLKFIMERTTPTALIVGFYLKYLLEQKGLRKRQRFILNNLRRFLIQNQHGFTKLKGLKIEVKGRLNGRNRSTTYTIQIGCLPLQTFSHSIDYSFLPVFTIYGVFGLKVWVVTPKIDTKVLCFQGYN